MNIVNVTIEDIRKVELEILLEFDRICKKNNINYQLFAGSLLGAIRHKGFIPWDDDIDVCLLRKDYKRFINVCKTDLSSKYFLQTYETDKNYPNQFAKIRKNGTVFIERSMAECKMHQGIYIDIFPLDNVLPSTFIGKVQQKSLYVLSRLDLSRIRLHSVYAKKTIEKYISYITHYILKFVPKKWTDLLQTKIACMFNNKETKYISHLTNGASYYIYNTFLIEKSYVTDTIDWEFEGYEFPIPRKYDEVLTANFGEYLKLPPVEERKPHHNIIKVKLS